MGFQLVKVRLTTLSSALMADSVASALIRGPIAEKVVLRSPDATIPTDVVTLD